MRCYYYLTSTLDSTHQIADHLHDAGVNDWFFHVISKDEEGLKKDHIHSGNYLEKLDILRDGIIGAVIGFVAGMAFGGLALLVKPFGDDASQSIVYFSILVLLTMFGAWNGGLTGIANENNKIAMFHDDLDAGKYLILIYARKKQEDVVKKTMAVVHPEAELVAIDANFFNPLTGLERI